jgi:hypothetical protein
MAKPVLDKLGRKFQTAVGAAVDTPTGLEVTQRVRARILGPLDPDSVSSRHLDRNLGGDLRRNQTIADNARETCNAAILRRENNAELALWTLKLLLAKSAYDQRRQRHSALTRA